MRSGKIHCTNDELIDQLITDPKYVIQENGTIWRIKKKVCTKVGWEDSEGYLRFSYKRRKLFIHRVIYRKFIGVLESDLVINHKDNNNSNNSVDNLELVTQKTNINYKFRRLGYEETY